MTITQTRTRALATIETITRIDPIPNADAIVRARVRGWDVVVKLDEFGVGDPCVYFEVDTLLEVADPRFEFLASRGVRVDDDGTYGHVLKTARLRGQFSQGLALPLSAFPELAGSRPGDDVTDLLPLTKWEVPIPADLAGSVRGPLPDWISKTGEERIQNLEHILQAPIDDWVATEKVDGWSVTYYVEPTADGDIDGACTHQWDMLPNDKPMWRLARQMQVHAMLKAHFPGAHVAVQGELIGPGFRGNPLQLREPRWVAFNLRIDRHDVPRAQWPQWLVDLAVPIHPELTFPASTSEALAQVDSLPSGLNPARPAEGVVWRSRSREFVETTDGMLARASFKVVSNRYLLKHDL